MAKKGGTNTEFNRHVWRHNGLIGKARWSYHALKTIYESTSASGAAKAAARQAFLLAEVVATELRKVRIDP